MSIPNGYHDVPSGKLANVATYLEMTRRPETRPDPPDVTSVMSRVSKPELTRYRALFQRIGAPWLWSSRLAMNDEQLEAVIHHADVEVYVVRNEGVDAGMLELDFRIAGECEIAFLGLIDALVGTGTGRWLMNRALKLAWKSGVKRVFVHTCNLDHPRALDFYMRAGFVPYKRQVEIYDDPRVLGLQPRDAAPGADILPVSRKLSTGSPLARRMWCSSTSTCQ